MLANITVVRKGKLVERILVYDFDLLIVINYILNNYKVRFNNKTFLLLILIVEFMNND
jgi:hypothetical protein